jgi:hypothetical protein
MLSRHLHRGTETNHEKYQVSRGAGRDRTRAPPGYRLESLLTEPPCPVCLKLTLKLFPCQVNHHAMKTCVVVSLQAFITSALDGGGRSASCSEETGHDVHWKGPETW